MYDKQRGFFVSYIRRPLRAEFEELPFYEVE
jgi:hypothetical protein